MEIKKKQFKPDNIDGNSKEEYENDEPGEGGRCDERSAFWFAAKNISKSDTKDI